MEKIKLNLGCGEDIKQGFVNVDILEHPKIKKANLNNKKLPFKENYADYIFISHLIEYLDDPWNFMEEVHRISKNDTIIDLIADHYSFGLSYAELRHKRPGFSYFTFGTDIWNSDLNKNFQCISKKK